MASKIVNWNVLIGEESLSYHQYIEFSAITQRSQLNTSAQPLITKWKYSANKHDLLKGKMDEAVTTHSKNATAESLDSCKIFVEALFVTINIKTPKSPFIGGMMILN